MRHGDKIQESAKGITALNCKGTTMPTATESQELTKGHTLTQDSYFVFYGEHDKGAKPGVMIRETLERAEWSAKLMAQCGYQFTEVRHALSVGEMGNEDA
jgi:hypothetical protein